MSSKEQLELKKIKDICLSRFNSKDETNILSFIIRNCHPTEYVRRQYAYAKATKTKTAINASIKCAVDGIKDKRELLDKVLMEINSVFGREQINLASKAPKLVLNREPLINSDGQATLDGTINLCKGCILHTSSGEIIVNHSLEQVLKSDQELREEYFKSADLDKFYSIYDLEDAEKCRKGK